MACCPSEPPLNTLEPQATPPVVLCLSGHDPSGGAGLQADIEAVAAMGGHAATVPTCLTDQDSRNVHGVQAVGDDWFANCVDRLAADLDIRAIKVGVVGSAGQAACIARLADRLNTNGQCPVVVDPVLIASGGGQLADDPTRQAVIQHLLPRATLLTPNLREAMQLTDFHGDANATATALRALGAGWVLLTGGDSDPASPEVEDCLYNPAGHVTRYQHARLPHRYHGSGCSLASACAAALARQPADVAAAVSTAIESVYQWLEQAWRPGQGQHIPRRR